MPGKGVQGLAEAYSLFDKLPSAAHEELVVEMGIIGGELLVAQHADVPKDTGALDAGLSLRLILERLKLRVGLLRGGRDASRFNGRQRKAVAGGPFYGRIVEFGRAAQTVLVTRRIKTRKLKGNNRKGNTRRTIFTGATARLRRRGPNAGTPIGSGYKLRVKAKGPRHFVQQPLLEEVAESHLSDFWANALARLGSAA